MPLLEGKITVVTGGGSGIGRAACRLSASDEAKVVVSNVMGAYAPIDGG